jgi:hypothetical protein
LEQWHGEPDNDKGMSFQRYALVGVEGSFGTVEMLLKYVTRPAKLPV